MKSLGGGHFITLSWVETLMHPLKCHKWLVTMWAAGFAVCILDPLLCPHVLIVHPPPPGYPLLLPVEMMDNQLASGAFWLMYSKNLMLLAWIQSILWWHAENTEWEAFPCTDQSVLQKALNLCAVSVCFSAWVSFLQLDTKNRFELNVKCIHNTAYSFVLFFLFCFLGNFRKKYENQNDLKIIEM